MTTVDDVRARALGEGETAAGGSVPKAGGGEAGRVAQFTGDGGTLFRRVLGYEVLKILTLGIYRFWAITKLRRYLWSRVEIDGDPLEYHGTPMQLFKGFLIALAILGPLLALYQALQIYVFAQSLGVAIAANGVFVLAVAVLWPIAVYRAKAYKAAMTSWRGVRFSLDGSAKEYAVLFIAWGGLTVLTLGLAWPWMYAKISNYWANNMWYGDAPFRSDVEGGPIFKAGIWLYVLCFPLFFLYPVLWLIASIRAMRSHVNSLSIGPVQLGSTMRAGPPAWGLLITGLVAVLLFSAVEAGVYAVNWRMVMEASEAGRDITILEMGMTSIVAFVAGFVAIMILARAMFTALVSARMLRCFCEGLSGKGLDRLEAQAGERQRMGHGEGLADALGAGGGF